MIAFDASHVTRLIAAFDSSGIHRVGSPGDFASGEWLANEARAAGAAVSHMSVAVNRTIVDDAYIDCAGRRIDGLPMFDSPPTGHAGLSGALGSSGSATPIGCLDMPPNAASIKHMRFELIRRETKHAALVVATRVTGDSLAPINAQYFDAPFGPPVVLVAGANAVQLEAWAHEGAALKLVSVHRREPIESYNIVAQVVPPTTMRGSPLIVVTPRTGWWESTAERGGGLVAWLAAIAAAQALSAQGKLHCTLNAYATCGHELGHLGLSELLARDPDLVHGDKPILHLGANLGCASNLTLFLRAADVAMAAQMRDLLTSEGYPAAFIRVEPISAVSGEGRDLTEHGARVLSMAGANAHFHAASDRWPGNVNVAGTAAIARAVARWITLLSVS